LPAHQQLKANHISPVYSQQRCRRACPSRWLRHLRRPSHRSYRCFNWQVAIRCSCFLLLLNRGTGFY